MSGPVPSLMRQELKRCFEALRENQAVWDGGLAECGALVSSLGNLAVQMQALKRVRLAESPLARFPGLQGRLHHKLCVAADAVLGRLADKLDVLQRAREAVGQRVSALFRLYERNSDALHVSGCVSRSAVCPSVSDMMEWLQDAERFYRLQLVQRRTLLQTLTPGDLTLMETAPKRWESLRSASGEERIADALCQVSFFMETE